ncbi:MAG: hypothetical protein WC635_16340 [Bacteriovorax sp.]|jgi:hypothetical protein
MKKHLSLLLILCIVAFSAEGAEELKPYTVFLKKGTLLTNLKDKEKLVLPKGIYAKVLELNPKRRNRFYVYDSNGIAAYETSAEGVVEVEEDTRLLPNIDAEKSYPAKSVFKTTDQFARFDSQLSLHVDNLQVSAFNEIYNDEISSVIANRYEVRTLYVSDLPFKFGLTLNYQSAYWKNDFEDVKLSILSVGPQFKYTFYKTDNYNAHAIAGAEYALNYEGSSASSVDKYSAQLYDIGIESEWLSPLGILTFGSHYRHHEVALSSSDRTSFLVNPKEFSVTSLGIMLGYKIEWEL